MKRLIRMVLSRTSLILTLLLLQIIFFFVVVRYISSFGSWSSIFYIVSIVIVIYMITKEENPQYKITWIIPILVFPLFGGLFYLFYRKRNISAKVLKRHTNIDLNRFDYVEGIKHSLKDKDFYYLSEQNFPNYKQTESTLYGTGESMYLAMLEDLKHAKKYIFLEFFIISKGQMWDSILNILIEKAKSGVEVKLIYDDFGSSSLPYNYPKLLKTYGIEAIQFNRMRIHLNFVMNYRDHRKIVVIDGKIGYTGGINIGDEYINKIQPFGHWLDAGIRLEGDAVWSLVITFLENYRFSTDLDLDYLDYKSDHKMESDGFVIPFSDTPLDRELTTKNIYLSMIMSATHSIDITTPYLIIDNELLTALKLAARSGVVVRIIIPYVPDKKIVFMVTESYLPELIAAGVNVYRYEPGFIHSKMMIIDDKKALIGTANLDYRSLYLHFENSVYLSHASAITKMTEFIEHTLTQSICITQLKKPNLIYKMVQLLLRGFSTLM